MRNQIPLMFTKLRASLALARSGTPSASRDFDLGYFFNRLAVARIEAWQADRRCGTLQACDRS